MTTDDVGRPEPAPFDPDELDRLSVQAYWRGRRGGLGREDAEDVAIHALEQVLANPGHPNPAALYNRIWHSRFVDRIRKLAREESLLQPLGPEVEPDDGGAGLLFSDALDSVRRLCARAGIQPGTRLWQVTMHTALGHTYADMAWMRPKTTEASWRKAWSRAKPLLEDAWEEEGDQS